MSSPQKIINPYLTKKWTEFHLASSDHALSIYDTFKEQLIDKVLQLLEDSFIVVVFCPLIGFNCRT